MLAMLGFALCAALSARSPTAEPDTPEYLVCCAPAYDDAIQPLVEWERSKGIWTENVDVSGSCEEILGSIRWWYNLATPPTLKYVLLVGSPDQIPGCGLWGTGCFQDCYYGNMEGDYRMEISVGRLPARTVQECNAMVAKILAYERPPAGSDTSWFLKGTTIVREGTGDEESLYYWRDTRAVHGLWANNGYAVVDSLSQQRGDSSTDVNVAASDGRSFITFRGSSVGRWYAPFDQVNPASWHNGARLPVVVSGSCQTLSLEPGAGARMQGDSWICLGSPESLGSIVSYFGTTSSGSHRSPYRSAVFRAFFEALYERQEYLLGTAAALGRDSADQQWPGDSLWYLEWNLLGDPTMPVWVGGVPRPAQVDYPETIPWNVDSESLLVSISGQPVEGARVCLRMDPDIYLVDVTGASGVVTFSFPPDRPYGNVKLTVTEGHAAYAPHTPMLPYEDSIWLAPKPWTGKEPMPPDPSNKAVKAGGWLATDPASGLIYGAKGNKTADFYLYSTETGAWAQLRPVEKGIEGKLPSKGCRGACDGQGHVYMTKGNNTAGFWRYSVNGDSWTQLPDVPFGVSNKRVKDGADLAFAVSSDTGYVYLLKGNKFEFYRFNCTAQRWETLAVAPGHPHKWSEGSFLVYDGEHTIYTHKAKYDELYAYDVQTDSWSSPQAGMPFLNSRGQSRRSRDGGSGAWLNGCLYALKGGNTQEFWRYNPSTDSWHELDTLPQYGTSGLKKMVKGGGDIVPQADGSALYALKGNNTREFWRGVPQTETSYGWPGAGYAERGQGGQVDAGETGLSSGVAAFLPRWNAQGTAVCYSREADDGVGAGYEQIYLVRKSAPGLEVRPETGGLGHATPSKRGAAEALSPFHLADETWHEKQEESQL